MRALAYLPLSLVPQLAAVWRQRPGGRQEAQGLRRAAVPPRLQGGVVGLVGGQNARGRLVPDPHERGHVAGADHLGAERERLADLALGQVVVPER